MRPYASVILDPIEGTFDEENSGEESGDDGLVYLEADDDEASRNPEEDCW